MMEIKREQELFGLIGNPKTGSFSPWISSRSRALYNALNTCTVGVQNILPQKEMVILCNFTYFKFAVLL